MSTTQAPFMMMRGLEGRHRLSDENEVNSLNHDQGGNFVISGGVSRGTAAGGNILLKIPTQAADGTDGTTLGSINHDDATTALTVSGLRVGSDQITTVAVTHKATVGSTLEVTGNTTVGGDLTVSGNDLTFGSGATIVNTDANTLTITEATTAFSGAVTTTGNATVGSNLTVTGNTMSFGNN